LEANIAQLDEAAQNAPYIQQQVDYLKGETNRLYVDEQGIIKGTPLANYDAELFTQRHSDEGLEIRKGINNTLAAQSHVNTQCFSEADGPSQQCLEFNVFSEEMLLGYTIADRLAFSGKSSDYDALMGVLNEKAENAVAFAKGFGKGAKGAWDGLVQLASSPIETTEAIAGALWNIDKTAAAIKKAVDDKYNQYLTGDSNTRAEILGEVTFEIVSSLIPASKAAHLAKASKAGKMLSGAVKKATSLRVVEKVGEELIQAGLHTKPYLDKAKTFLAHQVSEGAIRSKAALEVGLQNFYDAGLDTVADLNKTLVNATEVGLKTANDFKAFATSNTGKVINKVRDLGVIATEYGYKAFNLGSDISNPMPGNGRFARVMPAEFVDDLKAGNATLSRVDPNDLATNEAFITAADDLAGITRGEDLAKRLSLYTNRQGTTLRPLVPGQDVIVEFNFKGSIETGLRSPIELPNNLREYGFSPGGRTGGGAREWLIDGDAPRKGYIDLDSITVRDVE
ncbi:MAG: hypothetical protein AAF202_09730, partial [Pseudomonadota bacterium]